MIGKHLRPVLQRQRLAQIDDVFVKRVGRMLANGDVVFLASQLVIGALPARAMVPWTRTTILAPAGSAEAVPKPAAVKTMAEEAIRDFSISLALHR